MLRWRLLHRYRLVWTAARALSVSGPVSTKIDMKTYDFLANQTAATDMPASDALPFDRRRHSESFGQLVRSDHMKRDGLLNEGLTNEPSDMSPYRNEDGSFIKGESAAEARLHDLTLLARVDHHVAKLPEEVAMAINNNILRLAVPDRLRERAALIFQSINNEQLQKAPVTALDCDAHIAALFLQNYSHSRQVLLELQKRIGADKFNPQTVLDIGYGPATGIVALNDIMGDEWVPEEKEAYIIGRNNWEMKKRAKIILSRQINENFAQDENNAAPKEDEPEKAEEVENEEEDAYEEEEHVGPIRTGSIHIRTKLRDTLPSTKKYDLIMVNQSLLTREFNFPRDIDTNMHMILRLLKPGGHLVLIERGNTLGFETIARARQIMIRPESFKEEVGKIPRPYIRGSSIKPQRMKKEDQLLTEEDIAYEEELLAKMEEEERKGLEFEDELNEKYGEPTEEELKFDFEDEGEFEVVPVEQQTEVTPSGLSSESVDYHISILAPCPHHAKCPLQLGDPKYYKIPSHKHRLNFCSFNKVVERPRYTVELKKGKRLASEWDRGADDGFGIDKLSKKDLQKLEGTGRPGGRNTENGSFSYLIAERSHNDVDTINKIDSDRKYNHYDGQESDISTWPRILDNPSKIKSNVRLNVCSPTGNVELWQVPKSMGKQEYHDARKVERGDLWALGNKTVTIRSGLSDEARDKLEVLHKTQKKTFLKEQRRKKWKKLTSRSELAFEGEAYTLADSIASELENTKKYKTKGKKAKFDVDVKDYDGQ